MPVTRARLRGARASAAPAMPLASAFGMRAPEDVASRSVDFRTNLEHEGGSATNGATPTA